MLRVTAPVRKQPLAICWQHHVFSMAQSTHNNKFNLTQNPLLLENSVVILSSVHVDQSLEGLRAGYLALVDSLKV